MEDRSFECGECAVMHPGPLMATFLKGGVRKA